MIISEYVQIILVFILIFTFSIPIGKFLAKLFEGKDSVKIEITDQGIGIPKGEESKIFERFYRSSNVNTGGTGLGLSIVKEVLSLHGGDIEAMNNVDKGASFKVTLPKINRKFA